MVDRVKNFLTFSLIAVQNLVVVSHTVYMHVGGPKQFGGRWDPAPWEGGVADRLETRCSPTCVIFITKLRRPVKPFGHRSLVTICGDACPISCVSAEACFTRWSNAQDRRDGEVS